MLVLSRKLGESIKIGDNIRITVSSISGQRVRLGIEAPLESPVHRAEVAERIREDTCEHTATGSAAVDPNDEAPRSRSPTVNLV